MTKKYLIIVAILLPLQGLLGQTLPSGSALVENYLRRQQLLGNFDPDFSFNYRPIALGKNGIAIDSAIFNTDQYFGSSIQSKNQHFTAVVLPVEMRLAYDLRHPDSRNDGAMIPSRGLQTYLSLGFHMNYGPLSVQFKPEFIWAQNKDFLGFPNVPRHTEEAWALRYIWFNRMDVPEKFGDGPYRKFHFGQSSIRLNKWGLSLGLSTENIWWGPAIRNSIMMSNNAAGFPHITFNTQRPIKSPIGHFEWQLITARLEGSGFEPPATDRQFENVIQYNPKVDDWRYYQGISITYSPKWVKGLSLGFSRWVQQYYENAKATGSYFPIFQNLFRKNDRDEFGFNLEQDQAAGIFGKWVWYDAKAEFYFEFAKNDAAANLRDLLVDTDHSRAMTVGINKIFPGSTEATNWQFNFEWTQTSQTESGFVRNSSSWLIHSNVRHGLTHNGEVLGVGLGPGGNAQYMEVAWVKGLSRIGGALERFVHNNDFYLVAFPEEFNRRWIDYNIRGFVEWKFDKLLISGSLFFTNSLNYQWETRFDPNNTSPFPNAPGVDRTNWNLDIKASYTL